MLHFSVTQDRDVYPVNGTGGQELLRILKAQASDGCVYYIRCTVQGYDAWVMQPGPTCLTPYEGTGWRETLNDALKDAQDHENLRHPKSAGYMIPITLILDAIEALEAAGTESLCRIASLLRKELGDL